MSKLVSKIGDEVLRNKIRENVQQTTRDLPEKLGIDHTTVSDHLKNFTSCNIGTY